MKKGKKEIEQTAFHIHYKENKHISYKNGSKVYCVLIPLNESKSLTEERIFIHYN